VGAGQAAAGLAIDFYAYTQIDQTGSDVLGFNVPAGGTAYTPDPIAVLASTPRRALAVRFVEFVLSERGQRLWACPVGSRLGPLRHALFRPPILPSLYAPGEGLVIDSDPYRDGAGFVLDGEKFERRSRLLGPLIKVSCIQLEDMAHRAWREVVAHPGDPGLAELFDELPFSEAEGLEQAGALADPIEAERLEERWYRFFKARYARILEIASGGGGA
jgi:iron(III) transport system substrate-binding protein